MGLIPLLRRVCKSPRLRIAGLFCCLALAAAPAFALTERILVDPTTGIALYGIDPVAYFTDHARKAGVREFEGDYAGATWRFANEGNRAAFLARPDVYAPKFGGYDPIGVTQGRAVAGNPEFWLIFRERLFLFYSVENMETFRADPQGQADLAQASWPRVMRDLVP